MTHPRTTPQAAKPGLPRLRPVVSCAVRAARFTAVQRFSALLFIMCASLVFSCVNGSNAYAETTQYEGVTQREYIQRMAQESGLSDSEFVSTTIGALSATTGMVLVTSPGLQLVNSTLGNNLSCLVSAADYPDWDTLTQSQKQTYGTKENYDSTKYVSLMDAFDLSDGYERFQQTGSSGGGFTFNQSETATLDKIGSIGKNWSNRIGQSINDLRSVLAPDYSNSLYEFLYGEGNNGSIEYQYTGTDNPNWPEGQTMYYKLTNVLWVHYNNGTIYQKIQSSDEVYGSLDKRNTMYIFRMFSKSSFKIAYKSSSNLDAQPSEYDWVDAEYRTDSQGRVFYYRESSPTFNNVVGTSQTVGNAASVSNLDICNILYGENDPGDVPPTELVPDLSGYPENEVSETTIVYYPAGGIAPDTTWNQYTTVQRPENPFNPDDETSTPEWQQETKQNIQGLQGVRFDKLFPFCLYYDLQKFWGKVQSICGIQTNGSGTISTQASNAYDEIELRFYIPNVMDDTWTFDLEPLRNLLLIVKPFMLVFLIGVEIISLIMLWKGILTGQ